MKCLIFARNILQTRSERLLGSIYRRCCKKMSNGRSVLFLSLLWAFSLLSSLSCGGVADFINRILPSSASVTAAMGLSDGGGRQSVSGSGARENPFFGKNRFCAIDRSMLEEGKEDGFGTGCSA